MSQSGGHSDPRSHTSRRHARYAADRRRGVRRRASGVPCRLRVSQRRRRGVRRSCRRIDGDTSKNKRQGATAEAEAAFVTSPRPPLIAETYPAVHLDAATASATGGDLAEATPPPSRGVGNFRRLALADRFPLFHIFASKFWLRPHPRRYAAPCRLLLCHGPRHAPEAERGLGGDCGGDQAPRASSSPEKALAIPEKRSSNRNNSYCSTCGRL
jgi:hypothetical protein